MKNIRREKVLNFIAYPSFSDAGLGLPGGYNLDGSGPYGNICVRINKIIEQMPKAAVFKKALVLR